MNADGTTTFSVEEREGVTVLAATGELDRASAASFRAALDRAVAVGAPLVVVDMDRATFLDSAGLSVVFAVHRRLGVEQRIALGRVPDRMMRTLRLAAVVSVIDCWPQGTEQPWLPGGTGPVR